MPKLKPGQCPKLCRHHRGQAFVKINGVTRWLGQYGSPEAAEAYDRLVGEWLANGRTLPPPPPATVEALTVTILVRDYWNAAKLEHSATRLPKIKSALGYLRRGYGSTPAIDFGPVKLKAVRARMIDDGLTRTTINEYVRLIRNVFRFAVANQVLPPAVVQAMEALPELRKGKSAAKEGQPRRPVDRQYVRLVRPHLSRPVRALIDLQLLTGARPGELWGLRAIDIDTTGDVWVARLEQH